MPRPKGSTKKDKNQSIKLLSSSQTSIHLSNDFHHDDMNWLKTSSIINKMIRPKKTELININDDYVNSPISSSSEISGGSRVVINPAVLRYLEQNRLTNRINHETEEFSNENLAKKDENVLKNQRYISINESIQDEIFSNFSTYSTDFLTTAHLAQWILNQNS